MLVIYVPGLQAAFHTVPLTAVDWLVATGVASTLLFGMEAVKLGLRIYFAPAREPSPRTAATGEATVRAR
jgi:hypothetical protein